MTARTGDRQLIKELNIALVMHAIMAHSPISRVGIAERTGLGRSTITGIINILLKEGLVDEIGSADTASGRKPILLTLNQRALYAIGIKLAPQSATVALVDLKAEVIELDEVALSPAHGADEVVSTIQQTVESIAARAGVAKEKLLGVGVVMPGVVDPATGLAVASYFLGWANVPIRELLAEALGLPVYVDNDANAAALAEALYGAGQGAQDLLGLTVGIGIGAGVIIDGQIHRGARFSAGELGHVCMVKDGPLCACGRRGCLEAVASDVAIIRSARAEVAAGNSPMLRSLARGHLELITREIVVEAAKAGDQMARGVLAEAGQWLGIAVGNAVNLLSSSRVVVGGEAVLEAGELILGPMRETIAEVVFPTPNQPLPVVQAALGRHAWVQGAAALVLADAFRVPYHQQPTVAVASRVGQTLT